MKLAKEYFPDLVVSFTMTRKRMHMGTAVALQALLFVWGFRNRNIKVPGDEVGLPLAGAHVVLVDGFQYYYSTVRCIYPGLWLTKIYL